MTIPMEYVQASKDFEAFMADFMVLADLPTHHRAYHSIRAVLHVFRAHLSVRDGLRFADFLPPVLRAIYVEDWKPLETVPPFPDRSVLFNEIKSVRRDHNLAPPDVIAKAAQALRRHVDTNALDRLLQDLPDGASDYWSGSESANALPWRSKPL